MSTKTAWASSAFSPSIVAATLFVSGCMHHATAEGAYSELADRAEAHHAASVDASNAADVRAETERYAADMPRMMDDMMAMCADMMGSGMMDGRDMDRMDALGGQMNAAVGEHHARMAAMTDLAAMRGECETHHAAMVTILAEMRGMLTHGGMM